MVYGTQIVGTLFVLVMIYLTFLYYKRHEFGRIGMIGWMVLWFGALFLIIFPQSIDMILQPLNFGSVTQLLIVLSIMILFGFSLIGNVKLKNIEKKIDGLSRETALKRMKK